MNFENYEVDDFLTDESFQSYALGRDAHDVEFWNKWIAEHPEKRLKAEEAVRVLNSFKFVATSGDEALFQEGLTRLKGSIPSVGTEKKSISLGRSFSWKVAASIALAIGIVAAAYQYVSYFMEKSNQVALQRSVPLGQKLSVVLPDGSQVKMNGGSTIEYTQNEVAKYRRVVLTGEAFFEVKPDQTKPFSVISRGLVTTAVGTSFNIKAYPEENIVTVFLATGKIKVSSSVNTSRSEIFLSPGLAVNYDVTNNELLGIPLDMEDALSWRDGIIKFSNADINQVSSVLRRWYGVDVKVVNPPAANWKIEGTFKNESLENVVRSLQYTSDFDYQLTGKELTLTFK